MRAKILPSAYSLLKFKSVALIVLLQRQVKKFNGSSGKYVLCGKKTV